MGPGTCAAREDQGLACRPSSPAPSKHWEPRAAPHNAEERTDLSEAAVSELRTAVEARLQGAAESVLAAWPADRVAARIRVALLLQSIDDLWYPAMDDLVVLTDEPEPTVVVLDHEEQLTSTRIQI